MNYSSDNTNKMTTNSQVLSKTLSEMFHVLLNRMKRNDPQKIKQMYLAESLKEKNTTGQAISTEC